MPLENTVIEAPGTRGELLHCSISEAYIPCSITDISLRKMRKVNACTFKFLQIFFMILRCSTEKISERQFSNTLSITLQKLLQC